MASFHILMEAFQYTFISINPRSNKAWAAGHGPVASLYCRFMDTNVYGTRSVKIWENCHKYIRGYTDIFLQCTSNCNKCFEQLSASTQVEHFLNNAVISPLFTTFHTTITIQFQSSCRTASHHEYKYSANSIKNCTHK